MMRSSTWFCHMQKPNATAIAASEMISRPRSSCRWSTTLTRSSWPRRPTATAMISPVGFACGPSGGRLPGGLLDACDGDRRAGGPARGRRGACGLLGAQGRLALAAERVLEAPHPAAERAAHLGQPLGAEHEEQEDEQECDVDWIVKTHGVSWLPCC